MRKVKPRTINRYESPVKATDEPQKKYPSVTLDLSVLPEAKNWDIDKEYDVTLRLKMTGIKTRKTNKQNGLNSYDSYDYDNNATFDITGVEVKDEESEDEDTSENGEE